MSGPLRSKQGCWTCRLRRKKCDERRLYCSTCESLAIPCYGFGPKPDWMNDPEKERAVSNSLKEIVKHTSRRKATTQSSAQPGPTIRIAPKPSSGSVENPTSGRASNSHTDDPPRSHQGLLQEDGAYTLEDDATNSISPKHGSHPLPAISADESVLLMHYFDHVLPLQYPMYKPKILVGGRGWLLSLLLRTGSFYHAALALSAYHRRTSIFANINHPYRAAILVQQEQHLEICINSVNQVAQNSCPKNALGIATAVVQLMFFELFTSHYNTWEAHLRAAISMYHRGNEKNFAQFGLTEKSRIILCEDLSLSEDGSLVTEEVVQFRFFRSTLFWLDVIFSITAGTAPQLPPHHFCVIASNSQTKLEDIMGCKNWVMLQIGRIAALNHYKSQALQQGLFDRAEFDQNVDDISRLIQCGLTEDALQGVKISGCDAITTLGTNSDPPTLVTYLFAYMASVYLHLVTYGFQRLEVLDTTVSEVMRMLQVQIPTHLLPALVCPLFIVGSVARPEDKGFFRSNFSSPPLLDAALKHRERILPVLEGIWRRRQTTVGFEWKDILELTHGVLLI